MYDGKNDYTRTTIAMYTLGKWHIQTELHYSLKSEESQTIW